MSAVFTKTLLIQASAPASVSPLTLNARNRNGDQGADDIEAPRFDCGSPE